jgi:S-adenosylmethionine-diacylglycerol 3-amino-3-carboxypropyl transferase
MISQRSRNTYYALRPTTRSEIAEKADFSTIRYAQVWEDADVLLAGLDLQPGDRCLSIAAAGDNTLALLARAPARVIALDLNPAQLFCLELRVAAYRALDHSQLLALMGSRPCADRAALYQRCRPLLGLAARAFWDGQLAAINRYGLGGVGRFERYFRLFRSWLLPLVHDQQTVRQLLAPRAAPARRAFFEHEWQNWRWRLLVRFFFSQQLMGKVGRDPAFFAYVDGDFAAHVTSKIRQGLCTLDPATNPYLHWILTGTHGAALPFALRAENFASIRRNLDRLEWHLLSVEEYTARCRVDGMRINKFNLSNIFEYMSETNYAALLEQLLRISAPKARLLYWNMMVPRQCPPALRTQLQPLRALAEELLAQDKAIFYSALQIEEVV